MSGARFDRDKIVAASQSAAPTSKPIDYSNGDHPIIEHSMRPAAEGLYDPSLEKDSCGVGFIADIKGRASHQIVTDALSVL